jgi:DNA-binding HxlR family transcriptional regulator
MLNRKAGWLPTRRTRYAVIIELLNGPLRPGELEGRLAGRISKAWLHKSLNILVKEGIIKRSSQSWKNVTYELQNDRQDVRTLRSWITNVWTAKQSELDKFQNFVKTVRGLIPRARSNKEESSLIHAATYSTYSYLAKEVAESLFQEASLRADSEEDLFLAELNQRYIQKFHEIAEDSLFDLYQLQAPTVVIAKADWIGDVDRRTVRHLGRFARLERHGF